MIWKVYVIFLLFLTVIPVSSGVAQQSEEESYTYTREFLWGVSKNTNSGLIAGLELKYSRAIKQDYFQSFSLEIVNVKHPRELRYPSFSGNTYIWGKKNYLYAIRPQYGREWVLFKKAPQQGVQISASLSGGPSIGLVAPYYVRVRDSGSLNSRVVPWSPEKYPVVSNRANIDGPGPFLKGLGEADIKIGANIKAGLSFEFGTFKNDVTGFETGFQLEAFTEKIVIMPAAENQAIYPSAYIMLFYGSRK